MSNSNFSEEYVSVHERRFVKTLDFMEDIVSDTDKILDIGPTNPLSKLMRSKGLNVTNTELGTDLDLDYDIVKNESFDVVTAFEIFEHMVSPFPLIKSIEANKLIASVPLRLWFKSALWSATDPYDRHYHEFEPKQFDMLLNKAGWKIEKYEFWKNPTNKLGIRPILRRFTNRYYIVYCTR